MFLNYDHSCLSIKYIFFPHEARAVFLYWQKQKRKCMHVAIGRSRQYLCPLSFFPLFIHKLSIFALLFSASWFPILSSISIQFPLSLPSHNIKSIWDHSYCFLKLCYFVSISFENDKTHYLIFFLWEYEGVTIKLLVYVFASSFFLFYTGLAIEEKYLYIL